MSSLMRAGVLTGIIAFGTAQVVSAQERKTDEPSGRKSIPVLNAVEGRTMILTLLPQGTRVKKGDLVCELDSSGLRDRLADQKLVTLGAQLALQKARLTREVADIAVVEYMDGIFKQEWETVAGEIALADSERKLAEIKLATSSRLYDKGQVSKEESLADKVGFESKVFAHELAQTKKKVLEQYTKAKTIKKLQVEVEGAKGDELFKRAVYKQSKATEERLTRQIESCKLVAPADGRLDYPPAIEEGADVRTRQLLFRVIADEEPKAETKPSR